MVFKLLTVGDGDLSFSLAIKRAYPDISVTASTLLESPAELIRTYSNSSDVIAEFRDRWKETIMYGVDATKIEEKLTGDDDRYDMVLFNHPHLGSATLLECEEKHAKRHHVLLAHYFSSSKKVLEQSGVIHVCLCGTQPETWDVIGAAKKNGLYCVMKKSTDCPIDSWLFRDGNQYELAHAESSYRAKRKFRNGKLGSKHFLSRYGYMHRRTEGELFRGTVREVNVQQSINLIFAKVRSADISAESNHAAPNDLKCSICQMIFSCREELVNHLANPALPDINAELNDNESPEDKITAAKKQRVAKDSSSREPVPFQPPTDIDSATILVETIVTKEFDSTRIKWLCRQPSFALSRYIKSKKQCEDAIKAGRVFINRQVALNTGRIVHENDAITLIEEQVNDINANASCGDELQSGVKIIEQFGTDNNDIPSLVVAYKPVGVRCIGQFASDTLEMITKKHFDSKFGRQLNLQCLSKIDTGCSGLCVLTMSDTEHSSSSMPTVVYSFTALVHGIPDESWKTGVYVNVAKSGNRNWKRQKTKADDTNADDEMAPSTTQLRLDLNDALFIRCPDTYCIPGDNANHISTLHIESSHDGGRLANTISYILRRLGYPVVNDRFAKRESSSLPRRMRNLMKQKVCIGCYQVNLIDEETEQNHVVSIEAHSRTQCRYWRDELDTSK